MAQVDGLPCLVPSAMWKLYAELNEDTRCDLFDDVREVVDNY